MIKAKCTTNIKVKEENFDKFVGLLKDQLVYGAKKYTACQDEKEATDLLIDAFGVEWLLGTMTKYIYRYKNLGRERDILKLATYAYLLWIIGGHHLQAKHDGDTWNENKKEIENNSENGITINGISDEEFGKNLPGLTEKDYE